MTEKPHRLIRLPEVMDRVGLSKATVYARIERGDFPAPVRLGASSRWVESEIDAWVEKQIEIRNSAARFCAMPATPIATW